MIKEEMKILENSEKRLDCMFNEKIKNMVKEA